MKLAKIIPGILLALLLTSCKNDEAEFISYRIADSEAEVQVDLSADQILLKFPEEVTEAGTLVAEFEVSEGARVEVNGSTQKGGQTKNNFELPFTYGVESENGEVYREWEVQSSNNDYALNWGMGGFISSEVSNGRNYPWYLDQGNSGNHSLINCGPTATTMAALWFDGDFPHSPEDARAAYRPDGGWWYTSDIGAYLEDNKIPHYFTALGTSPLLSKNILRGILDQGDIAIVCLDMYYISKEKRNTHHVGKFYHTSGKDWGHFIVARGYKTVDGITYLETNDPYSLGQHYSDDSFKGESRYYNMAEILGSARNWWNYLIVISSDPSKGAPASALDPAGIPHARGR